MVLCSADGRHLTTACSGRANQRFSYPHSFVRAADAGRYAAFYKVGCK